MLVTSLLNTKPQRTHNLFGADLLRANTLWGDEQWAGTDPRALIQTVFLSYSKETTLSQNLALSEDGAEISGFCNPEAYLIISTITLRGRADSQWLKQYRTFYIPNLYFLKIFFYVDHLKSLLNLLQYCFCFKFWFFGHEACRILAPRPRIEPTSPALEGKILTSGSPGKSGSPLRLILELLFWKCSQILIHAETAVFFPSFHYIPTEMVSQPTQYINASLFLNCTSSQ